MVSGRQGWDSKPGLLVPRVHGLHDTDPMLFTSCSWEPPGVSSEKHVTSTASKWQRDLLFTHT